MSWIYEPNAWIALLTLTALEIVLGIDNIVFISILAGRLPPEKQGRARMIGLALAMLTRIALLFSLTLMMSLTSPFFRILGLEVSGRDLILIAGGLFFLGKATFEIHNKLEGEAAKQHVGARAQMARVLVQIAVMDIIFSLDSVITAIGMARHIGVMVTAVMVAVGFMMVFAGPVSRFIDAHPTMKMLALSFLLLIGVTLVADGLHFHIPKGYIYFAMAFSLGVELLNLRLRTKSKPVKLRSDYAKEPNGA
jgi:predicted tellurium resistance membrane protein TerC